MGTFSPTLASAPTLAPTLAPALAPAPTLAPAFAPVPTLAPALAPTLAPAFAPVPTLAPTLAPAFAPVPTLARKLAPAPPSSHAIAKIQPSVEFLNQIYDIDDSDVKYLNYSDYNTVADSNIDKQKLDDLEKKEHAWIKNVQSRINPINNNLGITSPETMGYNQLQPLNFNSPMHIEYQQPDHAPAPAPALAQTHVHNQLDYNNQSCVECDKT